MIFYQSQFNKDKNSLKIELLKTFVFGVKKKMAHQAETVTLLYRIKITLFLLEDWMNNILETMMTFYSIKLV